MSALGEEKKKIVVNAMREDPTKAMRQLFSDRNISRTTVWRILN